MLKPKIGYTAVAVAASLGLAALLTGCGSSTPATSPDGTTPTSSASTGPVVADATIEIPVGSYIALPIPDPNNGSGLVFTGSATPLDNEGKPTVPDTLKAVQVGDGPDTAKTVFVSKAEYAQITADANSDLLQPAYDAAMQRAIEGKKAQVAAALYKAVNPTDAEGTNVAIGTANEDGSLVPGTEVKYTVIITK